MGSAKTEMSLADRHVDALALFPLMQFIFPVVPMYTYPRRPTLR